MMFKILGLAGSLRRASVSKAILRTLAEKAPGDVEVTIFDLADIPMFNQDLEADLPASVLALRDAVIEAGAVRFRPMLLTALAVVVGASVILADPIFQGLAISLMFGEIASLLISRMAVPVLYYMTHQDAPAAAAISNPSPPA